jgi:hypothetical protein
VRLGRKSGPIGSFVMGERSTAVALIHLAISSRSVTLHQRHAHVREGNEAYWCSKFMMVK